MLTLTFGSGLALTAAIVALAGLMFKFLESWRESKRCYVTQDEFKMFLESNKAMMEGLAKWMERIEKRVVDVEREG